jgi:hypothetical protein
MSRKPKPKKRGRKPGVKVGPYKKRRKKIIKVSENEMPFTVITGKPMSLADMDKLMKYEKAEPNTLTLCGQLEDTLTLLENRISNINARILGLL